MNPCAQLASSVMIAPDTPCSTLRCAHAVVLMKIAGRANSGTPILSGLAGVGFARCRRIAACCTITLGRATSVSLTDLKVHSGSPGSSEGAACACLSDVVTI